MNSNVFRFAIGPWKGKYSEKWRIWCNKNKDDIYLGGYGTINWLKLSLHESGICQISFLKPKYDELKNKNMAPKKGRHIARWERNPLGKNEIQQILDVRFPYNSFHHQDKPKTAKGKKLVLIEPINDNDSDFDSVNLKVLYHNFDPLSKEFILALQNQGITQMYAVQIKDGCVSFGFSFSKILPIKKSKELEGAIKAYIASQDMEVGEFQGNLSIMDIQGGTPPSITSIGGLKISKVSDAEFKIDFETSN